MRLKTSPRRARRAGFTLIEMLVVISIVVVLIGVGIGATMRFRDAATNRAADDQMNQLQLALNGQYDTVVSKCNSNKDPLPEAVLVYCDDPDRARAVHTAAMLRVYFPDKFAEATSSFSIGTHVYNSPPRGAFKQVAGSTGLSAEQQSAVLLFLILSEQAVGAGNGEVRSSEGSVKDSAGKEFKVFLDPWKRPIWFSRWARTGDLDLSPYAHASASGSIDPLDPKSRVATWTDTTKRTHVNNTAAGLPGLGFGTSATTTRNRVPSVFCAGKDPAPAATADDRFGYKLNRQGASGK